MKRGLAYAIAFVALVTLWTRVYRAQPPRIVIFQGAEVIGAMKSLASGQSSYSSSCAAGGFAVDLADLAKPPAGSTYGFVSPDLTSNGVIKGRYAIAVVRNAAPDVTSIGSPERTCNGSTHQPASSYFASATPAPWRGEPPLKGQPYFATDDSGRVYWSREPIPNPIQPGPHIHSIDDGFTEEKDDELFVALSIATFVLEGLCISIMLTMPKVSLTRGALTAVGLILLLELMLAPSLLRSDASPDPLAWLLEESLALWAVILGVLVIIDGVVRSVRWVRSSAG